MTSHSLLWMIEVMMPASSPPKMLMRYVKMPSSLVYREDSRSASVLFMPWETKYSWVVVSGVIP